jgi:hypothetical protein
LPNIEPTKIERVISDYHGIEDDLDTKPSTIGTGVGEECGGLGDDGARGLGDVGARGLAQRQEGGYTILREEERQELEPWQT